MFDNAPQVNEFGPGATTCDGDMTGCAVCATASVLIRYGIPIPRLSTGRPDMRTLGYRMGKLHRDAVPGNRHGLSLSGSCSPPQSGTNWCAYCAHLYFRSKGLPSTYADVSDSLLLSHLKARHSVLVPGLYSRVPIVGRNSYSGSVPALGRSDSGFGGTHMVAAHGVTLAGSRPVEVILNDSDFGSPSRPISPPHSVWSVATFLSFRHVLDWGVTIINAAPRGSATLPPKTPTLTYVATVRPASHQYYAYEVVKTAAHPGGAIARRAVRITRGFQARCSEAHTFLFAAEHAHVELVEIEEGGFKGRFISRKWSNQP